MKIFLSSNMTFDPTSMVSDPAHTGHATPHMPVETAKCWWLLKIEPNAWAGGKGSCAVCVDLQAVGALEFFGELCSLAKGFGPIFEGVWAGFREREGSIFSNHQHLAVSTGICGVACPLPASRVDKPLPPFIITPRAHARARGYVIDRSWCLYINKGLYTKEEGMQLVETAKCKWLL